MNVRWAEHSFRPEEVDRLVVLRVIHEHVDGLVEPQMGLWVVQGRGGRTVEHTRRPGRVDPSVVTISSKLSAAALQRPVASAARTPRSSHLCCGDGEGALLAGRHSEGRQHQLIELGDEGLPGFGVERLLEQGTKRRVKPVTRDPDKDLGQSHAEISLSTTKPIGSRPLTSFTSALSPAVCSDTMSKRILRARTSLRSSAAWPSSDTPELNFSEVSIWGEMKAKDRGVQRREKVLG